MYVQNLTFILCTGHVLSINFWIIYVTFTWLWSKASIIFTNQKYCEAASDENL